MRIGEDDSEDEGCWGVWLSGTLVVLFIVALYMGEMRRAG
jgi:hypothetical protein